ncbi:amidase [Bradyrhizobium australiense]|uniref:Amidase n=1 Tax=Bradyrhizobium australiense TaxID=2721161 RepID=A0A7Y4GQS5_9BRAD|nr:amidase [Bradyrhizobium australiense]NOJ40027.1 amidase [Bradyrhizobium australiense]
MGDLHFLELTVLAELIRTRKISPVAATRQQLNRIAALDGTLASYAVVTAERAMAEARAAEADIVAGRYRGPLHGVPLAVKDLFWTRDMPTAAGTTIHKRFEPAEDATAVRRLREAGAVLLGKLQMTEGAYSDHHPQITPPRNPWNADYWPGISSSGPGVAVAAGLCFGALASDTGGSIRWPSAANGLTGVKPTWGRVSRHGVFDLAPSLDHIGPMARSVADAAALFTAVAGADPADPTALQEPVASIAAMPNQSIGGLKIGVDRDWGRKDVDPQVLAILDDAERVLSALGAEFVEVQVPDVTQAVADWAPNCAVEAAVAHRATYPARRAEYGPVLSMVLEAGRALSGLDYQEVLLRRMAFRGRMRALFGNIDLLLVPAHPFAPLSLKRMGTMGLQPKLIARLQAYTAPFNMTGQPTLTLPGGFSSDGLPIAFQMVAADLGEATLIRAGIAFQSATDWHRRHPAL